MSFTAQYNSGTCHECGVYLVAGDELTYDREDRLCHASCVDTEPDDQPALFDLEQARGLSQR
jgi:hypothetical protein